MATSATIKGRPSVLRWVWRGFCGIGCILLAAIVVVMAGLNLPVIREFVRGRVNKSLSDAFVGQLIIDRIGSLRLDAIGGIDIHALDAEGRSILSLRGLRVRSNWPQIVRDLIWHRPLSVVLSPLTLDHVEVCVLADNKGSPSLASAFNPRHPTPPSKNGAQVTVTIDRLRVRHLWTHGSLPSLAIIDAEVFDLTGGLRSSSHGLSGRITGARIVARSLPGRIDPSGSVTAWVEVPSSPGQGMTGVADFKGQLASVPMTAHGDWNSSTLQAAIEAPAVPPSVWREHLPNSRIEGPTALAAHVHGQLPQLEFDASMQNQAATVNVRGRANLDNTTHVSCEVSALDVNLGPLTGNAMYTRLSVSATATLSLKSGGTLEGEYRASAPIGRLGTLQTPSIFTEGSVVRTQDGNTHVDGTLDINELGAPTRARYQLRIPTGANPTVRADFEVRLNQPRRLQQFAGLRTNGTLDGTAKLDLLTRKFSASANATLSPVVHETLRAQSLEVRMTAVGDVASPSLQLRANATDLVANDRHFRRLQVAAYGTTEHLRVSATVDGDAQNQLHAEARLSAANGLVIDAPNVTITDREGQVTVHARKVSAGNGRIAVDELEVSGLGDLSATGTFSARGVDSRFDVRDLDLARLARVIGLKSTQQGILNLHGQVVGPFSELEGRVQGTARKLNLGNLRGGQLDLNLDVKGRKINGSINGKLGRSTIDAQLTDILLLTHPTANELAKNLRGDLSVKGNLALDQLSALLSSVGAPLERASGQVLLDIKVQGPRGSASNPTLHAKIKTQNLRLVEKRGDQAKISSPSQAREAEPRAIEGIDVDLNIDVDPAANLAQARIAIFDRLGPLVNFEGESKLPQIAGPQLRAQMDELPLKVAVHIPQRDLQKLPRAVRPSVMHGFAAFELEADGTIRDPRVRARITVHRLQSREGKYSMEVDAETHYASSGGSIEGQARSTRGGTAALHVGWTGNLLERVQNSNARTLSALNLQSDIEFHRFPVGVIPALSDRQVRGLLSGEVQLRGLGSDARLQAKLDGSGMTISGVTLSQFKAELMADNHQVGATLDTSQNRGTLHAELSAPSSWGQRWVPIIDPHAKAKLKAREFQLATLSPLFLEYVSTLEGLIDADLSMELNNDKPTLVGTASLRDGVFQIPQVGQRFSDAQAKITVRDDEIRVDSIQARGITGHLTGEARAKLNGSDLISASAQIDIKDREKLPVTFEGVMIGDAWGHININYAHADSKAATEIKIEVPELHLKMPDAAQNSVQTLDPADDIRIGARRSDRKFVVIALQPFDSASADGEPLSLTRLLVHLGGNVWVERGRQAKVQLAGNLEIDSGSERKVAGRIELKGGQLDVSGKRFEIERGVISFEGSDASNPTVTATARWDSPANYTVYADYFGSAKDGKLKLHSEPSLSQDEILSLLLFGSPDGSIASGSSGADNADNPNGGSSANAAGSSNGAGAAVGVAGGTATKGLNRAISDVTNLDVSTRIDTSTGSARPELDVQLTPRLTTRVTRALGEPPPGQSPDMTFVTLELRLKRSWALSGTVGDHGASTVDLIWRKRY